jgi:hypothetical protein
MSTTLEKLQAEVEAEIINSPVRRLQQLKEDVSILGNPLSLAGPLSILSLVLYCVLISVIIGDEAFSYMMLLNPLTIPFLLVFVALLALFFFLLKKRNRAARELKALRSSDSIVNIEADRERFWNDLGLILDKDYDILIPITQRKNGGKFKSPAEAENMELLQQVDGVQSIIKLRNLVPYIVGEEVAKLTSSN